MGAAIFKLVLNKREIKIQQTETEIDRRTSVRTDCIRGQRLVNNISKQMPAAIEFADTRSSKLRFYSKFIEIQNPNRINLI